ncbi:MAG: hypothetical protein K1X75_03820 [Leptospirales bacterium]|nr:hypothetical protein [Leptospirales bacterium]
MAVFVQSYLAYRDGGDVEAGRELAGLIYRLLSQWLEQEKPPPDFLDQFDAFLEALDGRTLSPEDLLELGLLHCAEAIAGYRSDEESDESMRFYLNEARLPLFALIEENAYRMLKRFDFSEIDFQIFEIIQGPFPHESAQNFLLENEWVDVWLTLRYVDSLPASELDLDLLERLMERRSAEHERLIMLAYMLFARREVIWELLSQSGRPDLFQLPPGIPLSLVASLYELTEHGIQDGQLRVDYSTFQAGAPREPWLFCLLAYFEISQAGPAPGWLGLIEECSGILWTCSIHEEDQTIDYQPCAEYAAAALARLSDDELLLALQTSRVLPVFFSRLEAYNAEAFQAFLSALARHPALLLAELELAIESDDRNRPRRLRLAACADAIGYAIIRRRGNVSLVKRDELSS